MATLRNLIDGKAADLHDRNDVFKHLKNVKDAQTRADIAKVKLHSKLAPTRQLLDMIDQEHPMPGQQNNQQQVDDQGNPIQQNNQQQQNPTQQGGFGKPGQANPGMPNKSNDQQVKPNSKQVFPKGNKTSTKDKLSSDKDKKSKGKGKGFEVHIRGENEEPYRIDQMNVKKKKKRFDYHNDAGSSSRGGGRAIGLSTSRIKAGGPGSGRKATIYKDALSEKGFKKSSTETKARGQEVWKHKTGALVTFHPGGASHFNSNGQHIKDVSFE